MCGDNHDSSISNSLDNNIILEINFIIVIKTILYYIFEI